MLKKILKYKLRLFFAVIIIISFALIRAYENSLFYDPFLEYFKRDFYNESLPDYDSIRLFFSLLFRYGLNTLLSIGLIYTIFKDLMMVKFVSFLYLIFFVFLIISFYLVIYLYAEHNNFLLFYVRRFLIQPIFALLFIPAFYFQKKTS